MMEILQRGGLFVILVRKLAMLKFTKFALQDEVIQNLTSAGHIRPTDIQSKAIPLILEGQDLIGIAQTGTGKTAAFVLPIIQRLLLQPSPRKKGSPRVLILAPTRELCSQIQSVIELYGKNLPVKSCAIFGGVQQSTQVEQLRQGVDIMVATPGRLLDLIQQKQLRLSSIEIFVMDEADRMLDMGFIDDIEILMEGMPQQKQTLLFSATMPLEIESLAQKILITPNRVEVTSVSVVPAKIQEKLIYCKKDHKFQLLKKILKDEKIERGLIFANTMIVAEKIVEYLALNRMASKTFHGDLKQNERERALKLFKEGSIKFLVATDMASRGIDVEDITHIINFDIPLTPETYIHRIGRSARSGKEGMAISFCDDLEKPKLQKIEEKTQQKFKSEKFEGKSDSVHLKLTGVRKKTKPTPGKSQEKTAYLDHSKRQTILKEGEKRTHPGFKNNKKKKGK
jgi:ATP-dependent RNA helicase RhlE